MQIVLPILNIFGKKLKEMYQQLRASSFEHVLPKMEILSAFLK
jgi:hypothetical protein